MMISTKCDSPMTFVLGLPAFRPIPLAHEEIPRVRSYPRLGAAGWRLQKTRRAFQAVSATKLAGCCFTDLGVRRRDERPESSKKRAKVRRSGPNWVDVDIELSSSRHQQFPVVAESLEKTSAVAGVPVGFSLESRRHEFPGFIEAEGGGHEICPKEVKREIEVDNSSASHAGLESSTLAERHSVFLACFSTLLQETAVLLKKTFLANIFQASYEELRALYSSARRVLEEVEQGLDCVRAREIQRLRSEKANAEATAASERLSLQIKIGGLKQEQDHLSEGRSTLESEMRHLSEGIAEALSQRVELDLPKHRQESGAGRPAKFLVCQMCFKKPRDAITLPCMHLLYCVDCWETHKQATDECSWESCKTRMTGMLRPLFQTGGLTPSA